MRSVLIAAALVAIAACSPSASPGSSAAGSPEPTGAQGAAGLVADLVRAGSAAKLGSSFLAEPLPGQGVLVCAGTEPIQVYELKDHDAALAAASKIDPKDPSHVGTAIVEWVGRPRFWLRDRILILYVGNDAATDAALRNLLGQPFAESRAGSGQPLPAPDCA